MKEAVAHPEQAGVAQTMWAQVQLQVVLFQQRQHAFLVGAHPHASFVNPDRSPSASWNLNTQGTSTNAVPCFQNGDGMPGALQGARGNEARVSTADDDGIDVAVFGAGGIGRAGVVAAGGGSDAQAQG